MIIKRNIIYENLLNVLINNDAFIQLHKVESNDAGLELYINSERTTSEWAEIYAQIKMHNLSIRTITKDIELQNKWGERISAEYLVLKINHIEHLEIFEQIYSLSYNHNSSSEMKENLEKINDLIYNVIKKS